jgi:glycosyltransferase involved in cell wall biosynthesis
VTDDVHVVGLVTREEIARYVAAFDIAVQPQATTYASPLKLFEYMAMDRAIVAPDQPNIREVLTDGVDALLFEPGNPGDFRAALIRLVRDPALRGKLGAAAGRTIRERELTWDGNARRIVSLCGQAVGLPANGPEAKF